MKKYNLSNVMCRAWAIYRANNHKLSWSNSLRLAWQIEKQYNINTLYKKYYSVLLFFIIGKGINNLQAEEFVNDIFAKFAVSSFQPEKSNVSTYLHNIAKNLVIDFFRSKQNKINSYTDFIENSFADEQPIQPIQITDDISVEDKYIHSENMNTILSSFDKIKNTNQKKVAKMILIDGMSYAETASLLNIPVNSVKVLLLRAKKVLQAELLHLV